MAFRRPASGDDIAAKGRGGGEPVADMRILEPFPLQQSGQNFPGQRILRFAFIVIALQRRRMLAQRRFGSQTIADVPHDADEQAAAVLVHLGDSEFQLQTGATLAQTDNASVANADDLRRCACHIGVDVVVMNASGWIRHQHADIAADQLLRLVAKRACHRGIDRLDACRLIDCDQAVVDAVGDSLVPAPGLIEVALQLHGPQERAKLGMQDNKIHRLGEVVVTTRLQPGNQILFLVQRRQEHHR